MAIDNWTPLSAGVEPAKRYTPEQYAAAIQRAEANNDEEAAVVLRKAAQIEGFGDLLKRTGGQGTEFAPLSEMNGAERFASGAGLAVRNLGRGGSEIIGRELPPRSPEQLRKEEFLMREPSGVVGNVAGNVAATLPLMAIPGANSVAGAAIIGGGLGLMQPTGEMGFGPERLKNAASGSAGGLIGGVLAKGLSRVMNPSNSAATESLRNSGVRVTPGQAAGGWANRLEEKATSIPFIGDDIINARQRAKTDFNLAAINKILEPIKQKVDVPGWDGIAKAHSIISSTYDDLLKNAGPVQLDDVFSGQIREVMKMAGVLPDQHTQQLVNTTRTLLERHATTSGRMSGESFKRAESEFRRLGVEYLKSQNPADRDMGAAFGQIGRNLRMVFERQYPDKASILTDADAAWAGLKRIERASGFVGAEGGVFSPSQLLSAVKATDRSMNKSAFSRGNAYLQDFASDAKQVMGDKVGNSFTADRTLNALMLGGAGAGMYANPGVIAPSLAAKGASMAMYSPWGTRAMASLLSGRPELIRNMGSQVGRIPGPIGFGTAMMALEE